MKPERMKALVLITAWCGMRWGEVIELRRKDIAPDCSVINVSRGVTHRDKACNIASPKSGKGRAVIVPPHIREDIKHHLATHVGKDAEAQLFPAANKGCHLNDRVFRDYYNTALDAVGRDGKALPRPTIHDLRHFGGTQAARVGNLREQMSRLGHSTVSAAMRYQGMASGRDAEVADALSELAKPKQPEVAQTG